MSPPAANSVLALVARLRCVSGRAVVLARLADAIWFIVCPTPNVGQNVGTTHVKQILLYFSTANGGHIRAALPSWRGLPPIRACSQAGTAAETGGKKKGRGSVRERAQVRASFGLNCRGGGALISPSPTRATSAPLRFLPVLICCAPKPDQAEECPALRFRDHWPAANQAIAEPELASGRFGPRAAGAASPLGTTRQ